MTDDPSTFTCEACGRTLPKAWSDDDAAAEANAAFSDDELDDAAIVCDDCWTRMRLTMPDFDARYTSEGSAP